MIYIELEWDSEEELPGDHLQIDTNDFDLAFDVACEECAMLSIDYGRPVYVVAMYDDDFNFASIEVNNG